MVTLLSKPIDVSMMGSLRGGARLLPLEPLGSIQGLQRLHGGF
ncbi:MAG: hypothetical protein AB8Y91_01350 [Coxiella endosymbiont of Haemaphysalis japonica]